MTNKHLSPPQLMVLGFMGAILVGSILLTTPWAVRQGNPDFLTSLFTATSAVCVTGLVVVDTGTHWTAFGQTVILLLIQIGGLGIMSFATFFALLLGKKIQFRQRIAMQQAIGKTSVQGIVDIFRYLLIVSFSIEIIGAIILALHWIPDMGAGKAAWYGLFHSISAFNSCGMDLFGDFRSLTGYTGDILVNLVITSIIVIGGLGFLVLYELYHYRQSHSLSLHSRVVLLTTLVLIITGTLAIFILEYHNSLNHLSPGVKLMSAYFQSVSPRGAGFNTIDLNSMLLPTQLLVIVLMFIGGSPGSTAGGIKTSTFALMLAAILCLLRGKRDTEIFRRRIPYSDVLSGLSIILLAGMTVFLVAGLLSLTNNYDFIWLLFESASAFGTSGPTLGLTPNLDSWGRIVIIITMFTGRLGPLTIGYALAYKQKQPDIAYPEGRIIVG
ncbi:MAG: TrkH family potassium uptake protein [Syntrophomonadaceae bacterium]|jgi:trk system potassium uptake protein TrkH